MGGSRDKNVIIRCTSCGAGLDIGIQEGERRCQYCGTPITIPAPQVQKVNYPSWGAVPRKTKWTETSPITAIALATIGVGISYLRGLQETDSSSSDTASWSSSSSSTSESSSRPETPVAMSSEEAAVEDNSDPMEQLRKKLSSIAGCMDERASISKERYLSWADGKRGPTCREQDIANGLYAVSVPHECDQALVAFAATPPALGELDDAIAAYRIKLNELAALTDTAALYYRDSRYLQDACAEGQRLHPELMRVYAEATTLHGEGRKLLLEHTDPVLDAMVEEARTEGSESLYHARKSFLLARQLWRLLRDSYVERFDLHAYSSLRTGITLEGTHLSSAAFRHADNPQYDSALHHFSNAVTRLVIRGAGTTRKERRQWRRADTWQVPGSLDSVEYRWQAVLDQHPFGGLIVD